MKTVASLQRRERLLALMRWAVIAVALAGAVVDMVLAGAVSPHRVALLAVVGLAAAAIARELTRHRRVLQRLSEASREVTALLEPAEILHALCREAARILDAHSAIVYAYDGSWFHPVASHPLQALVTVVDEDRDEPQDRSLAPVLLTSPVWLEPDRDRPGRLAVPLRWRAQTTANVLVVRPGSRRPTAFEAAVASSLAESAAVALAHTDVVAAEQRNVRRLRYLEALRTRFVATVAHDLRSPLTVFKGVSQVLRRPGSVADDRVDDMLASVERQSNRLARLADDLLDAARMDADHLTLHPQECSLLDVVAATTADLDVEVDVDVDDGLRLVADPARLERILWNLLSNAEKYGKPPFDVRGAQEGDTVVVAVRDHGDGIDPAQRSRLFGEFTGNEDPASVGLGLAIVWQLVAAHGGEVTYHDADPGACFEIRLPISGPRG